MRHLGFALVLVLGCGDGGDDPSPGSTSSTTGEADTSSSGASASMSSTGLPQCDVPPSDCVTCWECAQLGVCKTDYDNCASNFECAGSLACIDSMCTMDGITQQCADHCCQNCAEHFICPLVDAVVTCVEMQCADLCGPAICTG